MNERVLKTGLPELDLDPDDHLRLIGSFGNGPPPARWLDVLWAILLMAMLTPSPVGR